MKYKGLIEKLVYFADFSIKPKRLFEISAYLSIGIGLIIAGIISFLLNNIYYSIIALFSGILLFHFVLLMVLYLIAAKRAKIAEMVLPDALGLIATNIKSGLAPDQALLLSARPEFGPLEKELKFIAKESLTTMSFDQAILEIPRKFDSNLLHRTFNLVSEGIKRGGEIVKILEETANDLRELRMIKREIEAAVSLQLMFIIFSSVVGAPFLFGAATVLIDKIPLPTSGLVGSPISVSVATNPLLSSYIFWFAIAAILVNSIFASFIIGLIKEGKKITGIKYFPVIAFVSMIIFAFIRFIMSSVFISMI